MILCIEEILTPGLPISIKLVKFEKSLDIIKFENSIFQEVPLFYFSFNANFNNQKF